MNIEILQLVEGAKKARGLTVIIDVFRAFTTETMIMQIRLISTGKPKLYRYTPPLTKIDRTGQIHNTSRNILSLIFCFFGSANVASAQIRCTPTKIIGKPITANALPDHPSASPAILK